MWGRMGSRRVAPAPPAASRRVMGGNSASYVDPLPFLQEVKRNVEIAQVGVVTGLVLLVQKYKISSTNAGCVRVRNVRVSVDVLAG